MLSFLWKGYVADREIISMKEHPSTLKISEDELAEIKLAWEKELQLHPDRFDGKLWRYEAIVMQRGMVDIQVSPVTYSVHNVMRHTKNKPFSYYPNPVTVSAVMVTADGYIPFGVRGRGSDQRGVNMLGAGFIHREEGKQPEHPYDTTEREILEETSLLGDAIKMEDAVLMGAMTGVNKDTTFSIYVPLRAEKKDISLKGDEHSDLLFLPVNKQSLDDFLNTGFLRGIPSIDLSLGGAQLYGENKYLL